jgi:hypothetical protein
MITAPRGIGIGIGIGVVGAGAQFGLIRLNTPSTTPLRGLVILTVSVLIGVIAGFFEKTESLKAASLMGFVAGVFVSAVGLSLIVQNPTLIGPHPFASAESVLSFASSVMAGTVISSWLVSGIAVLVALPLSISNNQRG